jgi:hypothetical protein
MLTIGPAGHASRIQQVYKELSEKIAAKSVAAEMFQRGALTVGELESIQLSRTPSDAARILLNILLKQPHEMYQCFLDALKQTGQKDAYLLLAYHGLYY